jgi:hypothetical protein
VVGNQVVRRGGDQRASGSAKIDPLMAAFNVIAPMATNPMAHFSQAGRPMAVDLTGAVAAAVVALEPEQWTDAIGCAVDEYEACLVEWQPDMALELVRSISFGFTAPC